MNYRASKRAAGLISKSILTLGVLLTAAFAQVYNEAPQLQQRVEAGQLLPVEERLPQNPMVVPVVDRIGEYGGTWRGSMVGVGDTGRLIRTIGYENLVRWASWQPGDEWIGGFPEVLPNIAESYEVNPEGTEYTFRLREGMKWSDGQPYTADDIMFWYEDVFLNRQITPVYPQWLTSGGEPVTVEKIDDQTVVFRFAQPHGLFLQWLATPDGTRLSSYPRHYMSQFHADHNDNVEELVRQAGLSDWVALFGNRADYWMNGDHPTIFAWVMTTALGEGDRVVAERNPFYWKVDPEGNQLPYIDRKTLNVVGDTEIQLLSALAGEIDMLDTYIGYVTTTTNKPILDDYRVQSGYEFYEVIPNRMNLTIISLNLAHKDPVKREIFNNKDFRIGLSHAINRQEIINLLYAGLGRPFQVAELPDSVFFNERLATQYTEFDLDLANEYLDRAGYTERDSQGFRLGPDGNPISFAVEVAGFRPEWVDSLELIQGTWREVGINMQIRNMERTLLSTRRQANEHDASVWSQSAGVDGALRPHFIMPFDQQSDFGVPWAYWYQGDARGEEPPAAAKRQMELYDEYKASVDPGRRTELMQEIMEIAADEFWTFGLIQPTAEYGIVTNNFHNVPEVMVASWLYPHPGPTNPEQYFISGSR